MEPKPRICVVGSANVDLTFRTSRLPRRGETLAGHAFHLGMGGKGANQAVAAARLGAQVALVARVGTDTFGQEALRRYKNEGIEISFVRQDADRATGTAAIIVDDNADNCILIVAGANAGLCSADIRAAASVVQNSDVVLCQLETPVESSLEAFVLARAAGVRTVLTPAPATELPEALLRLCDLCMPNEIEIEVLTGRKVETIEEVEAAAMDLRKRGVGAVVVTMGRRGALLLDDEGPTHVPAVEVKAVDPTGAGDSFTAALTVFLATGLSLRAAARKASVAAALTVTRIGTQAAFPYLADVESHLAVWRK